MNENANAPEPAVGRQTSLATQAGDCDSREAYATTQSPFFGETSRHVRFHHGWAILPFI